MGVINSSSSMAAQSKAVLAFPSAVPSSADPLWVNTQFYERITIFILVNNATTVTGSAVTVNQATDVAGSGSKAVTFTSMFATLDTTAADKQESTAVVSNTFTTLTTDNAKALYQIEILASALDTENGFNCIRVGLGNATAATITVMYLLWPPNTAGVNPSAIVD